MLFYNGLEEIIFTRNQLFRCDELIVLSGYVGPTPVKRLQTLPFHTTVIYGMYGADGIRASLHSALLAENRAIDNISILYSTLPVHSKCYVWRSHGEVVHALIGSANFSTNGLSTPYKEILAETTVDTFSPLDDYLKMIIEKAIPCEEATASKNISRTSRRVEDVMAFDREICSMPLYIIRKGHKEVPKKSGVNWGLAALSGSNVKINDAEIRIGADLLDRYPELFPPKLKLPTKMTGLGRRQRNNDAVEVLWDDGTAMTCLLEGSRFRTVNEVKVAYPKQISSHPSKSELGKYLRDRLGVAEGTAITMDDLVKYGRDTIDVSLQGEGIYYFDFSVR